MLHNYPKNLVTIQAPVQILNI